MPRKERAAKAPRAERFFADMESSRRQVAPGVYVRTPWEGAVRLFNQAIPCLVDAPLLEAIEKDFLEGDLQQLRFEVLNIAIWSKAGAVAKYGAQLSKLAIAARREAAADLAATLRQFIDTIESEVAETAEAAEKADQTVALGDEHEIIERGSALLPLLDEYAIQPLSKRDSTDHLADQFFCEFSQWWNEAVTDPSRRGARAVRNRIAAALWLDVGGYVSDTQPADEWARKQFGRLGKSAP